MTFELTQIDDRNFLVTPTNQPLPLLADIAETLGTSEFDINTQTTMADTDRRQIGSDHKGNAYIISQSKFKQPITTNIVTIR